MVLFRIVRALWRCFACWSFEVQPLLGRPQVVIAASFGRDKNVTAGGAANREIAWHVERLVDSHNIPFCVQLEVSLEMFCLKGGYVSAGCLNVHGRGYIGTRQTIEEIVENFCRPRGIFRVAIVAHPDHAWRVARVCEQLGLVVVELVTTGIPYDPASTQRWCRSAWNFRLAFPYPPFIPYEVLSRLYYLARGWIQP